MGLAWHMLAGRDRGVDRELYGAIDIHAPGPRWSKLPDRFPAPTPLATLPGSGSGSGSAATAAGQSKHENEVGASSTAGKKEGVAEETQRRIGRIQHGRKRPADEDPAARKTRLRRLAKVEAAFKHSWQGYKRRAWLRDELLPVTGDWTNPFGGWAATLVDSLDALWIMGWTDEFEHAVEATKKIDFTTTNLQQINVFETTIRYLGGFLSAYELSGGKYEVLLTKAKEVGELLICAFDTPNRMPIPRWYWQRLVLFNHERLM